MLMMCWFYCVPFAKLLYFAFGPLLFIFSLFALKRGIRTSRLGLRQAAFLFMFLSVFKLFIFDIRMGEKYLFCENSFGFPASACSAQGFRVAEFICLLLLAVSSFALFHYYRVFMPERKMVLKTPEQVGLRFWANLSMVLVYTMIIWTMAPWVGYLTIGSVHPIFVLIQWQHFAIANIALLMIGFWKVESCNWVRDPKKMERTRHAVKVWTPRDTLWLNILLFAVTLAFSYVAHDVLASSTPPVSSSSQSRANSED